MDYNIDGEPIKRVRRPMQEVFIIICLYVTSASIAMFSIGIAIFAIRLAIGV